MFGQYTMKKTNLKVRILFPSNFMYFDCCFNSSAKFLSCRLQIFINQSSFQKRWLKTACLVSCVVCTLMSLYIKVSAQEHKLTLCTVNILLAAKPRTHLSISPSRTGHEHPPTHSVWVVRIVFSFRQTGWAEWRAKHCLYSVVLKPNGPVDIRTAGRAERQTKSL